VTGSISPGQDFCIGLGRALVEAERDFILANREKLLSQSPEDIDLRRLARAERFGKVG
jgi:hypothetical protein